MLRSKNRLKKSKDIQKVLRYGDKYDFENIKIFILKKEQTNPSNLENKALLLNYDSNGNFIGNNTLSEKHITTKTHNNPSKLTVIISAKMGKAHDRNKFKRRVRNIMRKYILENHSNWIIISSKTTSKNISQESLLKELKMFITS